MTRPTRPDPLQPAERALADALAAATPSPGPSPGLDATILAAARKAAAERAGEGARTGEGAPAAATPSSTSTSAGHRRRRRSPTWLRGGALAATLVLAIGVAWQLRPQIEVVRLPEEAPAAAKVPAHADEVSAAASQVQEAITPPSGTAAPAPPEAVLFDAPHREPAAARETVADTAGQEMSGSAAKSSGPAPREAAASTPVPMAVPAPPPAPPAPAAPQTRQALPPPRPAPARDAAARSRAPDILGGAQAIDGEAMHAEDWLDQPLDDTPPASVDSPAVREAWLARIRELVASERYGEARESFVEFQRRHPEAAVPDDLRTLLGEE